MEAQVAAELIEPLEDSGARGAAGEAEAGGPGCCVDLGDELVDQGAGGGGGIGSGEGGGVEAAAGAVDGDGAGGVEGVVAGLVEGVEGLARDAGALNDVGDGGVGEAALGGYEEESLADASALEALDVLARQGLQRFGP